MSLLFNGDASDVALAPLPTSCEVGEGLWCVEVGCSVRALFWLGCWGICLLSALLFAVRSPFAGFRHSLLSRLRFVSRTGRVCVAFLLRVSVAFLLELAELAEPVEMPEKKSTFCSGRGQSLCDSTHASCGISALSSIRSTNSLSSSSVHEH